MTEERDPETREGDPAKDRPLTLSPGGVRQTEVSAVTEGADAVPEAHETINTQALEKLQVEILAADADLDAFIRTVSAARFNRYLKEHGGDKRAAVGLYHANAKISQCLYLPIHIWEVALRNRLNDFLCWKYGPRWPWDGTRLGRNLGSEERRRLTETRDRQESARGRRAVTTDNVVADLSAGFWVGLLTKRYDAQFTWRYNLERVFPAAKATATAPLTRDEMHGICVKLLGLRNRIAHHETIYHLPLQERHADMTRIIAALCERQGAYHSFACTFAATWDDVQRCLAVKLPA